MTNDLRDKLVEKIEQLPDVTTGFYKDTALLCVYYGGKEIAHFQTGAEAEIDIRLTPKIIKTKGLQLPPNSTSHPKRSKNSRWILQSFATEQTFDSIVELLELAAGLRATNS